MPSSCDGGRNRGLGDNCLNCAAVASMLDARVNYTCDPSDQIKCGIPSSSHVTPHRPPIAIVLGATGGAIALVLIVVVVVVVVKRAHQRRHIAYTTVGASSQQHQETNTRMHFTLPFFFGAQIEDPMPYTA